MISDLHIEPDFVHEMTDEQIAECIGDWVCKSLNIKGNMAPKAIKDIQKYLPELNIEVDVRDYDILITNECNEDDDSLKVGLYIVDHIYDVVENDPF